MLSILIAASRHRPTLMAMATMVALALFIDCADAQQPPPGNFNVRVITRDRAFGNIELGGRVWTGNPPTYAQMKEAEYTFTVKSGVNTFYFATPTNASPSGCTYSPEQEQFDVNVNGDIIVVGFFKCPEDTPSGCHPGPDSLKDLAALVEDRLSKYLAAVHDYGGQDFRAKELRREFLCYQLDQSNRLKQRR